MERTLILVKPDAFARNLTGEIIARFERKGLDRRAARADDDARAGRAPLRRARRASRSSASSSSSSPPGRWWRWCSRATRREGGAPGDRRDQPARGRARLDPRRLRDRGRREHGPRLRLARVGRARDRAVLPELFSRAMVPDPRLALAAAAGDPRAARVAFEVRPADVEELARGPPHEVARENALRKARRSRRGPMASWCSASTRSSPWGADLRQAGGRGGARRRCARCRARRHRDQRRLR
jgi:hypothetical protein